MDIPLPGEPIVPPTSTPVIIDIPLPAPPPSNNGTQAVSTEIPFPPPPPVPKTVSPVQSDVPEAPKASPVLGKLQAKKRLLAFSLSKQATSPGIVKPSVATRNVGSPILSFGFAKTSPLKVNTFFIFLFFVL
jgi:hypothetical protein